jgi:uncharacterized membrane protein
VHVAAAIVWVGGVVALALLNARLTRERDQAALRVVGLQSASFGQYVLAPAAVTTLLAGLALIPLLGAGFPFWMGWGLAGVFGSIAVGAVFLRPVMLKIIALTEGETLDEGSWLETRRRLVTLNAVNIALLLSTVGAMVFKPTL